jgi:type I restriction enzyme S subunit
MNRPADELPAGWQTVKLGSVGTWGSGGTPKRGVNRYFGGSIPWLKISDLTDGVVTQSEETITEEGLASSSAKLIDPGTLLIAMYGSIGKLGIPTMRCSTNQAVAFCVPHRSVTTSKFLFQLLLHLRPVLIGEGKGGNQSNISQTVLRAMEVPIPPLDEQERLVHLLETAASSRASAKSHLVAARRLIDRYRRAVLAAGCSGRLTAGWRGVEYDEERPAGWREVTFDAVCDKITVGHVGKMINEYRPSGVPFLRSQNVRELRFNPGGLKFVSRDFHDKLRKSALQPGDVVVVRSGFVGTACVIPPSLPEANCSDLVIVRPGRHLSPQYAALFINSPYMKAHISDVKVGSAQAHFNTKSMQAAPLLLPPLDEQAEITRRVEELLSIGDRVLGKVATANIAIERSAQAVLAKAFRGDLITNGGGLDG